MSQRKNDLIRTAAIEAAKKGNLEELKKIFSSSEFKSKSPEDIQEIKNISVFRAAEEGHLEATKFLLAEGADINTNYAYYSLLVVAARPKKDVELSKKAEVAMYLIEKGIAIDSIDPATAWTPLMYAEENSRDEPQMKALKEKLIEKGAKNFGALPYDQMLKDYGFELIKRFKVHVGGAVGLYKFVPNDKNAEYAEQISKSLGDSDTLILKAPVIGVIDTINEEITKKYDKSSNRGYQEYIQTFNNEWQNISYLSTMQDEEDLLRPKVMAVELNGIQIILNECLYTNNHNEPSNKEAINLEQYLEEYGSQKGVLKDNAKLSPPDFGKIFSNINEAAYQFHLRPEMLHLDIAPRNLVVMDTKTLKLKFVDFGLSLRRDENGKALNDPLFKRLPLDYYNREARVEGNKSIYTDEFAKHMTMIGALCKYGGFDFKKIKEDLSDTSYLAAVLKDVSDKAAFLQKKGDAESKEKGKVIEEAIADFGEYLTSMPDKIEPKKIKIHKEKQEKEEEKSTTPTEEQDTAEKEKLSGKSDTESGKSDSEDDGGRLDSEFEADSSEEDTMEVARKIMDQDYQNFQRALKNANENKLKSKTIPSLNMTVLSSSSATNVTPEPGLRRLSRFKINMDELKSSSDSVIARRKGSVSSSDSVLAQRKESVSKLDLNKVSISSESQPRKRRGTQSITQKNKIPKLAFIPLPDDLEPTDRSSTMRQQASFFQSQSSRTDELPSKKHIALWNKIARDEFWNNDAGNTAQKNGKEILNRIIRILDTKYDDSEKIKKIHKYVKRQHGIYKNKENANSIHPSLFKLISVEPTKENLERFIKTEMQKPVQQRKPSQ